MTVGIFELIGLALAFGTAGLLAIVSWDLRDDFAQMNRRLARRDARRAARAQSPGAPTRSPSAAGPGPARTSRPDPVSAAGER